MDEYVGMGRDHPNSQHSFMWKHFFSEVDVLRENCHFLDGGAVDLAAECGRFEAAMASAGGLDFTFFSTGEAGQVARNEPGSSLKSRTRPKTLATDTVEALALRWSLPRGQVPTVTLSVGVGTLVSAREVVTVFSGSRRARALEVPFHDCIFFFFGRVFQPPPSPSPNARALGRGAPPPTPFPIPLPGGA